jgi:hypothetical protein
VRQSIHFRFANSTQLSKVRRMSTRELIEKEVSKLPESLQREVYDFARFLRLKADEEKFNGLLLSESALATNWNTPEEDAAWASL